MIDGLGTHSMGSLSTLHQLIARREGVVAQTWPLQSDLVTARAMKRREEASELEYKAECEYDGAEYIPSIYSIFSASADFFA